MHLRIKIPMILNQESFQDFVRYALPGYSTVQEPIMTSLESRRSSFSKILSQDSYLAYVSADLEHDAYLVSGELRNRANEQSVLTGLLEAKHAINKTKMITNVDASGWSY